jgi:alpha-glucosidase
MAQRWRRAFGCGTVLMVAAGLALACAPVALASVTIGTARIVVSAPGASAVIARDPFRLSVRQASGGVALAEVANSRPGPMVVPPTEDPVPPGVDNQSTPTLYAPLSFLVGVETFQQYRGLVWGGDPISGSRQGVTYSARRVLHVRRSGAGVRLVVSTSDPTGRRLVVTVALRGSGAIQVTARPDPAAGVVEMGDSFASGSDEHFFGFGGRQDMLDQRGQVFSDWVEEENLGGTRGQPSTGSGSLFPNGPAAAYFPQAQFISSRPYGFLLAQPQLSRFKLDADRPDAWNVAVSAASLDYIVAPGRAPRAIRTLTAFTGREPVPPEWALGPMLDREVQNLTETKSDYQAKVTADLRNIVRYHLPLTAYRLEGWAISPTDDGFSIPSEVTLPFQAAVFRRLRQLHIHPLVYMRSWIKEGSAPAKEGLLATNSAGQPYYTTGTQVQPIGLLDFTNPAAVRFWQHEVAKALNLGADGFEQDFGEEVLDDMHFADGETGATMHNRYPILYARATRQELTRYARAHPHRTPAFFFMRSGYSGLPGSAAYEGGNWGGDETTDWGHASGLQAQTSEMLGEAVGGAYGFGTDIGGYADYNTPPTTKQLFIRWAEWAALTPVFRLHGAGRTGTHTPWSFDRQTVRIYNAISRLHLAAAPLILKLWRQAYRTGMPITRPLWLQYPNDPRAVAQGEEWLLGPDVLVAPVVTEGASVRKVYFPVGCWRSPRGAIAPATRRRYRGPLEVTISAPLGRLPYFFRCGTRPFLARAGAPAPRWHGG